MTECDSTVNERILGPVGGQNKKLAQINQVEHKCQYDNGDDDDDDDQFTQIKIECKQLQTVRVRERSKLM